MDSAILKVVIVKGGKRKKRDLGAGNQMSIRYSIKVVKINNKIKVCLKLYTCSE